MNPLYETQSITDKPSIDFTATADLRRYQSIVRLEKRLSVLESTIKSHSKMLNKMMEWADVLKKNINEF